MFQPQQTLRWVATVIIILIIMSGWRREDHLRIRWVEEERCRSDRNQRGIGQSGKGPSEGSDLQVGFSLRRLLSFSSEQTCMKEGVVQSPGDIIRHTSVSSWANIVKPRKESGPTVDALFTLDYERSLSPLDTLEIGCRQTPHQRRQPFDQIMSPYISSSYTSEKTKIVGW